MDWMRPVLALAACLMLGPLNQARANVITLTTGNDSNDSGKCSLRQATENHNSKSQLNKSCAAGSADDTIFTTSKVTLNSALPTIAGALTLDGNRAPCDTIDGGYFVTSPGSSLTFMGVGISNGENGFTQDRSLIDNDGGTVTILPGAEKGCVFSNHKRNNPERGGVILNRDGGKVVITGAQLQNSSAARGGAIYNDGGVVQIVAVDFSINGDRAGVEGGGIYSNGGELTISGGPGFVREAVIAQNEAVKGGGIFASGAQLSISGTLIGDNSTAGAGGPLGAGIYLQNCTAAVAQTYFRDNYSNGAGGAIFSRNSKLLVSASTFRHNHAHGVGGSIFQDQAGELKVVNSTINGERFNSDNEGIHSVSGSTQIVNSTIEKARVQGVMAAPIAVRNSILLDSICSFVIDDGFNLQFGNQINCPSSIAWRNPRLQALRDNGGPTFTSGLDQGSPAIDAIPIPNCTDQDKNPIKTDQRGFKSPAGPACDIGAFEFGAVP